MTTRLQNHISFLLLSQNEKWLPYSLGSPKPVLLRDPKGRRCQTLNPMIFQWTVQITSSRYKMVRKCKMTSTNQSYVKNGETFQSKTVVLQALGEKIWASIVKKIFQWHSGSFSCISKHDVAMTSQHLEFIHQSLYYISTKFSTSKFYSFSICAHYFYILSLLDIQGIYHCYGQNLPQ